jgi:hypothetical protein
MNRSLLVSDIESSIGEATGIVTKDAIADEEALLQRLADAGFVPVACRRGAAGGPLAYAGLLSSMETIWPVKVSAAHRKLQNGCGPASTKKAGRARTGLVANRGLRA